MATQLQELQAKRKELQATNPNASMLDARNALTTAISNAPVAGQPPAITSPVGQNTVTPPVTQAPSVHDNAQLGTAGTEATNRAQLEANKAKRQQMISSGAIPAVGEQATPAQVPQIVQQVEAQKVTPETTTTTEAVKVTPEVTEPTTTAPSPVTTPPKAPLAPTTAIVAPPTPRDKIANETFNKYNGMTSQQFLDNMKMGTIPSAISSQLISNPEYQKAQAEYTVFRKTQNLNDSGRAVLGAMNGTNQVQKDPLQEISDKYMKMLGVTEGRSYLDAFKESISSNDTIRSKTLELNAKQGEINEKIQSRDNYLKDLKKQHTGVPLSILVAMAANDTQAVNDEIVTLQNERDQLKADLDYETSLAKGEFDAKMKDMERSQRIQESLAGTLLQSQLGLQTKQAEMQMEADFAKRQAYENLNDPATAIANLMAMYQQKGIPFTQSLQTKLLEFANSGLTLGQYLDQMTRDIQAKPEYKALTAIKPTTTAEWKVIGKNADGSDRYGFVDATKGTITPYIPGQGASGDLRGLANQFPGQAWAKNNNPAGITWNANFDNGTGTAKLLQDAGIAYSKGTPRPAGEGGNYVTFNTIEDGLKAQQIIMTQTYGNKSVGEMLSSWVGTAEGPNYAQQVAGMAGIADLNQKVSSLTPDQIGKLQMAKIQKESPGLYGLLSQPAQATPVSQYTDQNVSDLAYLVELQEKNPTQASKEMKELGYTSRDLANYKGGNVPLTDRQKQSSINLANSIKDLLTNYDYTDATGFHFFDEAPRGSDWASAEEKIKTIVANMTLPNLGMLKGPMSDKDLAFIQAASSNLSTAQSDATFGKQLLDAYNLAARRAGLPEAKTLNDIKKETTAVTATGAGQTVSGNKGTYTW